MIRSTRLARSGLSALSRRCYASTSLGEVRRKWNNRLILSEEVEHALSTRSPIIALETAIVTHGMPHPTNYDTARSVESIIRSGRVTPATIALIHGKIHIGLTDAELQMIADPSWESVKVSRRDLAPVLSQRGNGGTTVAGTMYIAQSVGIPLFVTGGIGGVHRGAESSMDISADLIELGRTPMGVVCAGAKSILDIPRTLEVLETQGVCVAAYGQKEFPAFYTPSSGVAAPWSAPHASAAASLIHTGLNLPDPLATLLAVPPPASTTGDKVQEAVEQAVRESVEQGIDKRGKEATPWLLKRVGELTGGSSLQLNINLIEHNAKVGTEVAREMAKVSESGQATHASSSAYSSVPTATVAVPGQSSGPGTTDLAGRMRSSISAISDPPPADVQVQVFGSAAIDITTRPITPLRPGSTTPGSITLTPGGVGRNIAEAAQNLLPAGTVQLISTVGVGLGTEGVVDGFGTVLTSEMELAGLRVDGLERKVGERTAGCTLSLGVEGDLIDGVADMSIIETLRPETVRERIISAQPKMVVFDCNILPECIDAILDTAHQLNIPTFCDPTSTPKLPRLIASLSPDRRLSHFSPNLLELDLAHSTIPDHTREAGWAYLNSLGLFSDFRAKLDAWTRNKGRSWIAERGVVQQSLGLLPYVREVWVKCGKRGLVHLSIRARPETVTGGLVHSLPADMGYLVVKHHEALEIEDDQVVSTTGAGDTLAGGLVAGLLSGEKEEVFVRRALERVGRTMRSHRAVG